MKRKLLGLLLSLTRAAGLLAGCAETGAAPAAGDTVQETGSAEAASASTSTSASDIKIGVIYIGDENEGYTYSHMKGIDDMMSELGLSEEQVIEKTNIPECEECFDAAVDLADGAALTGDETVSMNFWGFSAALPEKLWSGFPAFLQKAAQGDPVKAEYFLPEAVGTLLRAGECSVAVLPCGEKWYGVTYPEDLQSVMDAVAAMKRSGLYPEKLWE